MATTCSPSPVEEIAKGNGLNLRYLGYSQGRIFKLLGIPDYASRHEVITVKEHDQES